MLRISVNVLSSCKEEIALNPEFLFQTALLWVFNIKVCLVSLLAMPAIMNYILSLPQRAEVSFSSISCQ